jgi:hypothetical protein
MPTLKDESDMRKMLEATSSTLGKFSTATLSAALALASLGLGGCLAAPGGETSEDGAGAPAKPQAAGASHESVTDSRPAVAHEAVKEVQAPLAGDVRAAAPAQSHETQAPLATYPIAQEEAEAMLRGVEAPGKPMAAAGEAPKADIVHICIPCILGPDLTVVEDDRDQWLWDPNYGWYQGFARGFDVKNIGYGSAAGFRVAVLMGSDSYGFDVSGLAAGASQYFQITKPSYLGPACGETATILVNPFNTLVESNYNNNLTTVAGICLL